MNCDMVQTRVLEPIGDIATLAEQANQKCRARGEIPDQLLTMTSSMEGIDRKFYWWKQKGQEGDKDDLSHRVY